MMQHNGKLLNGVSNERLAKLTDAKAVEVKRQRQIAMARRDRPDFD
ncbi:transcriptional antiterminator, partial [Agrobacterium vitis]|nr:transcriptional antiterminator [Agrobacterium vitis]